MNYHVKRFSQCYNVVVGCVSAVVLWTGPAVSSSRASPHQLRRCVQGRFHGEEVQAPARTRLPVHPSPPLVSEPGNIRPTSHCACADLASRDPNNDESSPKTLPMHAEMVPQ